MPPTKTLQLEDTPEERCDLGYIIMENVPMLMQLFDKELSEYRMQMLTSKCLNTAVMIMYMYLAENALPHTKYCDVSNVVDRYQQNNISIPECSRFKTDILDVTSQTRALFYIMITDGTMQHTENKRSTRDFPGHVFVIERAPSKGQALPTYHMYQSYIKSYKLKDFGKMNDNTLELTYYNVVELVNGIENMFITGTWSKSTTDFWEKFIFVNESTFEGYTIKDNIYFCYRKVPVRTCASQLKHKLAGKLEQLNKVGLENAGKIFTPNVGIGNYKTYGDPMLSPQQLEEGMNTVLKKLKTVR